MNNLIRGFEGEARFWDVIGTFIVSLKLLSAVLKRVHPHLLVKSSFVDAVLTFHLAVVPGSSNADPMIDHAVFIKQIFK